MKNRRANGADRAIHDVLVALRGRSAEAVGREAGVSGQTVRNLRTGKTLYPRFQTLYNLARCAGLELRLLRAND